MTRLNFGPAFVRKAGLLIDSHHVREGRCINFLARLIGPTGMEDGEPGLDTLEGWCLRVKNKMECLEMKYDDKIKLNKLLVKHALARKFHHLAVIAKSKVKQKKYISDATRYDRQAQVLYEQLDPEVIEAADCRVPLLCDHLKNQELGD